MAKVLMIQGTMSNAGKSFLVAGLCRIFHQDGFRAAPFKSQNMALNSFVTREGLEMGRAQVMQAEAAGIEPSVDMNPILLKPTSDVGSQVIVNGMPRGNMDARAYFKYKKQLIPDIRAAFSRLSEKADIIVVEGAGSPAEINLKENDIVNMGLAKLIGAPVLLVGNIDPGGVFAQLVGTVDLLEKEERDRIKGFVINKFRGDPGLLTSGVTMLTEKTGIPTIGILPYIRISLDDEDSLSSRLENAESFDREMGDGAISRMVEIVVVRLPHISNFTDFDVFDMVPGCRVRYASSPSELKNADLVILPGTKNTVGDLEWLWKSGMAETIQNDAANGTPVWGICGGYQMLGISVSDPDHMETKEGEAAGARGLGILPAGTVLRSSKILSQVQGTFLDLAGSGSLFAPLSGMPFQGYEIHMGATEKVLGKNKMPLPSHCSRNDQNPIVRNFVKIKEEPSGRERKDGMILGNICGSYIHGIFDAPGIAGKLVEILKKRKDIRKAAPEDINMMAGTAGTSAEIRSPSSGAAPGETDGTDDGERKATAFRTYREFKEHQYDLLADMIRSNMDMEAVYGCLQEATL